MSNEFIICLLGGWFGLHHFVKGNWKKGLLYFFTYGLLFIGWIVDLISIYKKEQEKKEIISPKKHEDKNNQEQKNEKIKSFECKIIMDCHKSECHRFINTCMYFELIDENDLYEGYTNKEIKDQDLKVYKCINCFLPCEIISNYENEHYEIRYKEHGNDYYFGYIPTEYNKKIYDIINNKTVTYGGISFENGLYKEYDYEKEEIIEGYDDYIINLLINYK